MKFVFDSTVLMYFAKLGILEKLAGAVEGVIPASVYAEVVFEGKKKGMGDALLVEKLVADGLFKVAAAKDKVLLDYLSEVPALSYADSETLALAKELRAIAVVDETASRSVAELKGIRFHGSVFLLFLLFRRNLIAKADIKLCIDRMIGLGWRCSTEFYAAILSEIEKI